MGQSTVIFGCLLFAYFVYITTNGELTSWSAIITGNKTS